MNCIACQTSLTGGVDTFGAIGVEMCWFCWSSLGDETDSPDCYHGLAPHKHSYDEQGNIIIGETTFLPLPEPDANGDIVISGYVFIPDPDAPGCGIYTRK